MHEAMNIKYAQCARLSFKIYFDAALKIYSRFYVTQVCQTLHTLFCIIVVIIIIIIIIIVIFVVIIIISVKSVKCTLVQALRLCTGRTAHRGSRGIALHFHDHGTRRG
jgi:uncharacterized membrane protein YccC